MSRELTYFRNDVLEHIPVIVALVAVDGHHQALEAHAGVHVMLGQLLEGTVSLAVVLDEHQIPYLYHQRVALIDQVRPGTALRSASSRRSICISLQGPQGPVSPISQKLSFLQP